MLTVTDEAVAVVADLLDRSDVPAEATLRLAAEGGSLGLRPDQEHDDDRAFQHDGRTVLVVSEELATQLQDTELGVQESEQGPQLALRKVG